MIVTFPPPQPVLTVSGGIIQPSGKSGFFVCLFVCFLGFFFVFLPAVFLINEIEYIRNLMKCPLLLQLEQVLVNMDSYFNIQITQTAVYSIAECIMCAIMCAFM